jgi:hypothetical protein
VSECGKREKADVGEDSRGGSGRGQMQERWGGQDLEGRFGDGMRRLEWIRVEEWGSQAQGAGRGPSGRYQSGAAGDRRAGR